MNSILGFLLINGYALLLIIATSIMFFSKQRLGQAEDKIYQNFLLVNILISISGLVLGMFVSPDLFNENVVVIFNKLYLISLILWIFILTKYTVFVSFGERMKKFNAIYYIVLILSSLLVIIFPIKIELTENASAVVSGGGVLLSYFLFGAGFLLQLASILFNLKNLKSKKYIPLYMLILFGSAIVVLMAVDPSLNYLINPALIFIAYIMYHTIENPDTKLIEEVHRAKEISDNSNEEKTIFLYNITNDIRNITRMIDDAANDILAESDNKKVDIEIIKEDARDIKTSTARFTTLTNEILDVSSMEAASTRVYKTKYNVKNLLDEVNLMYKDKISDEVEYRYNVQSDLPMFLYGDNLSLKKVIGIILGNSIKYTSKGYIEYRVNTIIKGDICRLIITIEDSGTGINSGELNKIFAEKIGKRGTNTLYDAKKLVTMMHGTIISNSVIGKGTTMKIVIDQKIGENTSNLEKYEEVYGKKKILLVGNTYEKEITKLLDSVNVVVDTVKLGKECLDKIRTKEKYDLILIEEDIKPLSGIEVMEKLDKERNFNTDVILLTKENHDTDYKTLGFSNYLTLPIEKDNLLDILNKHLK